ncbi:MAG: cell division protein ZapB [Elusimicrobiota bacterium]
MDKIDILERKIRQAAEQILRLREQNKKLEAEFAFLQNEQKKVHVTLRENETFKEERRTVSARIEKLLKKLNVAQIQQ